MDEVLTPKREALEALIEDGPGMSADDFAVAALPLLMEADNEIDRLRAEVRRLTAERDRAIADREPYIEAVRRVGADAVRLAEALRPFIETRTGWPEILQAGREALRQHEEQR